MPKRATSKRTLPVPPVTDAHIQVIRGRRMMIDSELASLYGISTGALNRAVKRNAARFPTDFMFQLPPEEHENLKCQIGISNDLDSHPKRLVKASSSRSRGGRRSPSHAVTEEGVAMLSSVLRSPRAVAVNIEIMRAFVRRRRLALSVKELAGKAGALEKKYDGQFNLVFDAIKELMAQPSDDLEEDGTIGFLGAPKKGKSATP